MKQSLMSIIKENKEVIIKKTLIVGGTIAGLFIAGALLSKDEEMGIDEELPTLEFDAVEEAEIIVETTEEIN